MTARQETADELRRRLYRAGANEEDLRRYLDARPEDAPEPPQPVEQALPHAPAARSRRPVLLALVGAAGVLAAVGLARPGADRATPSPAASIRPAVLQDVGEGRFVDVADGTVSDPSAVAADVLGTAAVGSRFEGVGTAVVHLVPTSDRVDGGRAAVTVATAAGERVTWRLLLDVPHPDRTSTVYVLARGSAARSAETVLPAAVVYPTREPTGIAIIAPRTARWTVVYADSAGHDPVLR